MKDVVHSKKHQQKKRH